MPARHDVASTGSQARSRPQPRPGPAGRVSRSGPGPALPSDRGPLGDARGLTSFGAVLFALGLGAAGALVDVATGTGLRTAFAVSFVLGCVTAAAVVHHEDLVATVVMPPLLFLLIAGASSVLDGGGGTGSWLARHVLEGVTTMVTSAPVLFWSVAGTLVVAIVRFTRHRITRRRRHRSRPASQRPASA